MRAMTIDITSASFCSKTMGISINTSMSAARILALVPASRYYCDVTWSYHNNYAKFH